MKMLYDSSCLYRHPQVKSTVDGPSDIGGVSARLLAVAMVPFNRIALTPFLFLLGAPLVGCGDGSAGSDSATTGSVTTATQGTETTAGPSTGGQTNSETGMETGSDAGTESESDSTTTTATTGNDTVLLDVGHEETEGETDGEGIFCDDGSDKPSNFGCEFWAVDMDQQDALNDPASAPWGVAISSLAAGNTTIVIEINNAAPGEPLDLETIMEFNIPPDEVVPVVLPTRELDCGVMPNDYGAPGTCLSSRAYRITSAAPIVVYQFNVFQNAFSNDASLLLPTPALGKYYRILGWPAGHPIPLFGIIDRSAVTIVGTEENTTVRVVPSWRIRGNPPIPAANPGEEIQVTLGPFDVLNLETDDGTFQDDAKKIADLTGTVVFSDKPVAVFSGVESTAAPGGVVDIPTHPGWTDDDTCCLDHLEEQMFPGESLGTDYVITRSPIRSTGNYHEPDVIRFLGVAETTQVTTSLPPPYDNFSLQPGEVRTTWADKDFTATGTKPYMIAQLLISQEYVDGPSTGDPALTVFPPVDQYRDEYRILTPSDDGPWGWDSNFIVLSTEPDNVVTIDDVEPNNCVVTAAGNVQGKSYESRRCPVSAGVHSIKGETPFGVIAYGYGSAGSYAFPGGADVERIYEPPM